MALSKEDKEDIYGTIVFIIIIGVAGALIANSVNEKKPLDKQEKNNTKVYVIGSLVGVLVALFLRGMWYLMNNP